MESFVNPAEIARVLSRLLQQGSIFPIYYSAVSNNGSMAFGRYWRPGEAAETIASHCPSGQFVLPLNMMIVDQRGKAVLIQWLTDTEAIVVD